MSQNELKLYFAGNREPELVESCFRRAVDNSAFLSVRGKTSAAIQATGSFQWTTAVRALSVLFIKIAMTEYDESAPSVNCLSGHKGSLASSLDYALSKQPRWIQEMFGIGNFGTAYARRLILRTNPERKRPGPVILGLNTIVLKPTNIAIFLNGEQLQSTDRLRELMATLEGGAVTALEESIDNTISSIAA
jgi:hypothetical protein